MPHRWTLEHVLAVIELVLGVAGAVWLIVLGVQAEAAGVAGRSWLDRSGPFLLAAAVGLGLGWWAVRRWRAANRAGPGSAFRAGEPSGSEPQLPPAPPPPLSPDGGRELARIVAVLGAAGVFAPRPPEPDRLTEAVADYGEPVTAQSVLVAIDEADWHRPDFDAAGCSANLAFHTSHTEQFDSTLRSQVADLVRLAGGALADLTAEVEIVSASGPVPQPTRIRLVAGGAERALEYAGAGKYLSTVLHVAVAGILRERGTGYRLAWLWGDQGVWLTRLPDGELDRLNTALGPAAVEDAGWAWVDEQPPIVAGEMYRPAPH